MKKYSSDFKLKAVLKYLSETNTAKQVCQEFGVSTQTLHNWTRQFKKNSGLIFSDSNLSNNHSHNKKQQELKEKEISNLYAKIGRLTVERDFLKKVLDT